MTASITHLFIYPIKSCRGTELANVRLDRFGFENDRRWVVVKSKNSRFVSQRAKPKMALIHPTISPDGTTMTVCAPGMDDLVISCTEPPSGAVLDDVGVWGDVCPGVIESEEATLWFSAFLGEGKDGLHLVRRSPSHERPVDPNHAIDSDKVANVFSFADGFPFLLVNQASMDDLNRRMTTDTMTLDRFRPNIVVQGDTMAAWDEDNWYRVEIGERTYYSVKRCSRCKLTTVDPKKGAFGETGEPLKTLLTFRDVEGGDEDVFFGENLIHEWTAADENGEGSEDGVVVRVGDGLTVVERKTKEGTKEGGNAATKKRTKKGSDCGGCPFQCAQWKCYLGAAVAVAVVGGLAYYGATRGNVDVKK